MKNPIKKGMDRTHRPQTHEDKTKYHRKDEQEILDELTKEAQEQGFYDEDGDE